MYKEAIFYFDKAYTIVANNGDVIFQKKLISYLGILKKVYLCGVNDITNFNLIKIWIEKLC